MNRRHAAVSVLLLAALLTAISSGRGESSSDAADAMTAAARALLASLDDAQRARAVVAGEPPADILTRRPR